jgi:excinuclease ABC subunit C
LSWKTPDLIAEWLSEKRGEPVAVRTAASGVLRDLLDIAERNAKQALREELFREEQEKIAREYALRSLQSHLNLPSVPYRIECYDISTTMGVETVGSMVVFVDGKPEKSEYRKFRVKGAWILDENDWQATTRRLRCHEGGFDEKVQALFRRRPQILPTSRFAFG